MKLAIPGIVLALFLVIPLVIGMWASKKSTGTAEDYFVQGRGMGMIPVFFTLAATWWSAFAFLGTGGVFFTSGMGYWFVAPLNIGFGLLYYVIGRKVWRLGKDFGYITPGDLFSDYYESKILRQVVSIVLLIFTIPYLQIQLVGAGYIIETMTHGLIPFWMSGLLFYAVIIFYVWVGGLRAVALTDVFYGILIFGGLILGGWWIAGQFGGVEAVFTSLKASHPEWLTAPGPLGKYSWPYIFSMMLIMVIGGLFGLPMWLRMYSVKSEKTFRYSIAFMGIMALGYLGTTWAAFSGLFDKPSFSNPDNIFPVMLLEYTPVLLASIVLAAAASAAMSTANSQLHAIATVISMDMYKQKRPEATQKDIIRVGHIGLVVFASLAYVMALTVPGLLTTIGLLAMGGAAQLLPGVVGILYWRRSTKQGAIWGTIVGSVVVAFATFTPYLKAICPLHEGLWGLIFNVIVFVVVSLCTTPPSKETRDRFTTSLKALK